MEHEVDGYTNCSWCAWNGTKEFWKETGGTGYQKKNRDYPNNNTDKLQPEYFYSPGEPTRRTVAQTSVKTASLNWCENRAKIKIIK